MRARLRLREQGGFTLSETLVVVAILGIVVGALVQLFVSASSAEIDMSNRFRAQQEGRLALDALRREIHCASAIASTQSGAGWPSMQIKITLGSYCPTGSGDVTWCTIGSSAPYALWRTPGTACNTAGGVKKADYLTTSQVFVCPAQGCPDVAPPTGSRRKLGIDLPVDVSPLATGGLYRLQDDIVLRNTTRSP